MPHQSSPIHPVDARLGIRIDRGGATICAATSGLARKRLSPKVAASAA